MKTKELIIMMLFIVTSLVVYGFFPTNNTFQQIITTLIFFVILPLLFNKFILKREFKFFGFEIGDYKQGLLWSAYSLVAIGFIFFVISYYFAFLDHYTIPVFITKDFVNFLFYEFILVVPFVVIYEFYFRGFVMPVFKSNFGYWAILIQALILLVLVLSSGGNIAPFVPYLIFAPFAGLIVYKSRSILYSGATQFIILFVLTLVVIKKIG